ncbi:ATP-binding protein [Alisedimentitalea sp. MJ-SS2]|uniref:ATP-binding protein n=1 Tax=Aliisedimentitalea sp. MJ-SS2 TaxID=3049795 RepID=UPI0029132061|nr:ATP-binding protein [Alisedimentitalea sp. MJ-SS2]MDU8926777.1 ATP-binding protein [Alisedimentitalea sp. MJ-SS2]
MFFGWLKRYMPRSLYGRAALILILPVVLLQLVVSIVFVQRHFEGVTQQMANTASREIRLVMNTLESGSEVMQGSAGLSEQLEIAVTPLVAAQVPDGNHRRWYDFSGLIMLEEFNRLVPGLLAVDLPDDHVVRFYVQTETAGPVMLEFDRLRVSARNPHQLFANMIFFGILLTVIAFIYLRNQLRPIKRLSRAAEAFGRGRNVPFRPTGAIEVRAAGNAFLDMRARIERQIEQRTLMLSGVSHDLRTPLTRMKLGLSLLDEEDRAPLKRDVEEMQRLLDEFLSFVRDASEGEAEPVDPIALVNQLVEDCQRAGDAVVMLPSVGSGEVGLRPVAMRRAVENLISNAVRYGKQAEVSVELTEKSLRIRVEDDGPGIPADRREEAMRPFSRLDSARNQNSGSGVGLGLAIAVDVARAHGGVLRLGKSKKLGGLRADIVVAR